jgi:hypothetical protein
MYDEDTETTPIARLDERFRAETTWAAGTRSAEPDWYHRLLSALVLVIGDSEIRYLSVNYSLAGEDGSFSTDVVVLTDEIVAYATFEGQKGAEVTNASVTGLPRRSLTSFGVAVSDDGSLAISVSYPDFARSLPLGASDWPHRDSETTDLIDCLRQDLVA